AAVLCPSHSLCSLYLLHLVNLPILVIRTVVMPRRKAANPIRRNVTGDGIGGRPPAPAPGPPADGRLSPSGGVG
ncbi:unnamed protein product, partial [Ectocarpus sp. 4 AP-2014]